MGASNYPGLTYAKGTHGAVVIEQTRKIRRSKDEKESDKVRDRSGRRCEIRVIGEPACRRRAVHVHHLIGGRMRGRGISALAQHKQDACEVCHRQLTGEVGTGKSLVREGGSTPWFTDKYRRVR